jgi:hypothetical protein
VLVADEDTWVMPKTWLRDVVRQRGFDPAPTFSVDPELAEQARQRAVKQVATLDRLLAEPHSDPELVRAVREHLAGEANPVGAATIAVMTRCDLSSVHQWIADHGLAFATEALIESIGISASARWDATTNAWRDPHLRRHGTAVHITSGSPQGQMLTALRYALAVADDAEREAAEAVLDARTDALMARAYLVPSRTDWFDEACAQPDYAMAWWMLP